MGNSGAVGDRKRAGEEGGDVGHDIDVRIGRVAIVHDDNRNIVVCHHARHFGVALQARNVVDDRGTICKRPVGDCGLHGVDRYRQADPDR